MKCKIVVGANYGDEGKGLVTHILTSNHIKEKEKVLNALYNGGCQRGHTVEYENGVRHVFKHFGSGALDGADTYFDKDFILNPTQFMTEHAELDCLAKEYFNSSMTKCFCHRDCRVSTPYDALLNQMVETNRDENRHGSCGWGIFETRKRYEDSKYNWSFLEMRCATNQQLYIYLESIAKEYLPKKIEEYGIKDSVINKYRNICISSDLINAYISDFRAMCKLVDIIYLGDLLKKYDTIIYEGGQGLALSETNTKNFPYLTPSKTGSEIPIAEIEPYTNDIEVIYVTRSYITRHGAGPLPYECTREKINPAIEDKTNFPNEFQKSLRFAEFDYADLIDRIETDNCKKDKKSLYITHWGYGKISGRVLHDISYYLEDIKLVCDKFGKEILKYE